MLGIVTDQERECVKAAIVKMYKEQDTFTDSEAQTVTYALTDEHGRFFVQNLDPDERYVIEVYVEDQMVGTKHESAADIQEMDYGHKEFSEPESNDSYIESVDDEAKDEDDKVASNVKVKINYEDKGVAKPEFGNETMDSVETGNLDSRVEDSNENGFAENIQTEGTIISNLNQNQTGRQFKHSTKSNQELELRLHSVKTCTWW